MGAVTAAMGCERVPRLRRRPLRDLVERTGRGTVEVARAALALPSFYGEVCVVASRTLRHPSRVRVTSLAAHVEQTGVDALPILGLLSFLIGVVVTFQGADQLRTFGAQILVVDLLGISVVRELGPLLTAILVAGRSGSAFTAQIGAMGVNQELDAMRTIGMDPVELLVLPRMGALMLVLPLLAFFAFAVALVGCFQGLQVRGAAESVGRLTTRAVVQSIFLVIVLDAAFDEALGTVLKRLVEWTLVEGESSRVRNRGR